MQGRIDRTLPTEGEMIVDPRTGRIRFSDEERVARRRAQAARNYQRDPAAFREYQRRFRERHRDRYRAHKIVGKRIERGQIIRPDQCERCHVHCEPEAHHRDYSKPLEIEFLCRACHKAADREVRAARRESAREASQAA